MGRLVGTAFLTVTLEIMAPPEDGVAPPKNPILESVSVLQRKVRVMEEIDGGGGDPLFGSCPPAIFFLPLGSSSTQDRVSDRLYTPASRRRKDWAIR